MHLSSEDLKVIRSASRWGMAVAVVVGLNMVVVLGGVFEEGVRGFVVDVATLFVMGWQAVAMVVASLAFVSRPSAESFESGLSGLRAYCKVGVLGWFVVSLLAGASCGAKLQESNGELVDVVEAQWKTKLQPGR